MYFRKGIIKNNNNKLKLQVLFVKIFTIIGTLWILSFLHYIIHKDHSEVDTTGAGVMETVFRIADGLNMLRGFFMFIILVCKKDILNKLKRKFMTDSEIPFETFTLRSPLALQEMKFEV